MNVMIGNEMCLLLGEKAVYWERENILFLADIHLGKAAAFRGNGVFIPEGTMDADLANVQFLIEKFKPTSCIIVGDLIHSNLSWTTEVKRKIGEWLKNCPVEVHLVLGNHDKSLLKNIDPKWPLKVHDELLIEPFLFSHYPKECLPWFVWAGHLHPKIEIKNGHDRLVLRCFQVFENYAILPTFSDFAGGSFVNKTPSNRIFAIANTTVVEI